MKKRWLLAVFASFLLTSTTISPEARAASSSEIIETASQYLGVSYLYGGTTTAGFDCSGFTSQVFRELGVTLNRTSASQFLQGEPVSIEDLQVGDLLFYNTSGSGISHVAIYIGDGKMMHSQLVKGVSINHITDSYWASTYVGAKRIAGLNDEQKSSITQASTTVQNNENVSASIATQQVTTTAVYGYTTRGEVALQLATALQLPMNDTKSPFKDVDASHPYAAAIVALNKKGIFTGDTNGQFNPNNPLTRAQMAKVLVLAFDLTLKPTTVVTFSDVKPTHWSYDYIRILASNGITTGIGNGLYGANEQVKKSQLNTFIARATK